MIIKLVETGLNRISLIGTEHSDSAEQLRKLRRYIRDYKPDIVLVEGNFHNSDFENEEEAIEKGKEMGYIAFLCQNKGITLLSNDPPEKEMFGFVKKKYGEETAKRYFDLRENKSYADYFNPLLNIHNFNNITRELNISRDRYMLRQILGLMDKYNNIMVVKGKYHINNNFENIRYAIENV